MKFSAYSSVQSQRFSAPGFMICFSDTGDEAVLNILWGRYQKAVDKVEKRRLLHVFLKQFLVVYKNWEPINSDQNLKAASTSNQDAESDVVVIGCFSGHPAEVILVLTEEITQLTALVIECWRRVEIYKVIRADRQRQLHELHSRMDENASAELDNRKAFDDEIKTSITSILALDDSRRAAYQLTHEEEQQNVAEKWIHMFRALIDERGPWSANPFPNNAVRHWKLDKIEDTWRRRQKLRQNYHFDGKLCQPSSSLSSVVVTPHSNESKSGFTGHMPEQMKRFLLKGVWKITDEGSSEPNETDTDLSEQKSSGHKDTSQSQSDVAKDATDWIQDRKDSSSSSYEPETSEVLTSVPCVLVSSKRKLAGHLAVKKNVLHFSGEFLVEGTGGSSVFRNFPASSNYDLTKPDQKQKFMDQPISFGLDAPKVAWSISLRP